MKAAGHRGLRRAGFRGDLLGPPWGSARARAWARCTGGLCALLACLLLVSSATAQGGPEDIRRELERTDEILVRARDLAGLAPEPQARDLVLAAERTQASAWNEFRAGHPLVALNLTRDARRLAFRAIDLVRGSGPGPGDLEPRAQQAIEHATRTFERARQCAGDPPSALAQRVLDLAMARLEEARQAWREGKHRLAVDIATQVERLLDEVCRGVSRGDVTALLENVDRLMERAAPAVIESGDPTARGMLERARELLARAHEAAAARNDRIATQHAVQARELLLRALRQSERPADAAEVDQILEEARRGLGELGERIRESGVPEAVTLFERAVSHLERAEALRREEKLQPALAETRVARNLAWRAARLAGL